MKNFKLIILLSFGLLINLTAKTIQVPFPNGSDIRPLIQSAVNSAVNGDIIELPAGRHILTGTININKFISFKSQGDEDGLIHTLLFRPENLSDNNLQHVSMLFFNIQSTSNSKITVTGILFRSKKPSMVNGDGLSKAPDIGIEFYKCYGFTVKNCQFENFGDAAIQITHHDSIVGGLVTNNKFYHNAKGYDALGLGYGVSVYGENKKWIVDPKFGSSNFIFIENNVFDYHRHSASGGGCALYVFRYNTVLNNIAGNSSHAIDAHEARLDGTGNNYSTRAIEVYNNTIINTTFRNSTSNCANNTPISTNNQNPDWLTETAIIIRGGEALIHDNYIEGYRFGVGLVADQIFRNVYPIPYQQGYLSILQYGISHTGVDGIKSSGDIFIWNNNYIRFNSSSQCSPFYNYSLSYIKEERDYHLYTKPNYIPLIYPKAYF